MGIDVEALFRRYGPMVLRRCRRLLRDENEATDAMQDVFVSMLRNRALLDDRAPSALLYTIATNICLNKLRTSRRHPEDPDEELLMRIAALDEGSQSRGYWRVFLSALLGRERESTRAIAVMHLLDGMTLEEVAEATGLSVSGVRKRLRALKARVLLATEEVE